MTVIMTILNALGALAILLILILFHELGHYTAGRALGFGIKEFSIGMGPKLIGWKRKGIAYSLRLLPIGGSCAFYGEDAAGGGVEKVLSKESDAFAYADSEADKDADAEGVAEPEDADKADEGLNKTPFGDMPRWKRAIVLFAGPFMNFVLAFLLSIAFFMIYGNKEVVDARQCAIEVESNSPAEAAGMQNGDMFVWINDTPIDDYATLRDALEVSADGKADVVIERDGSQLLLHVENLYNPMLGGNYLGIKVGLKAEYVPCGFFESIGEAWKYLWEMVDAMFDFVKSIFTGGVKSGDVMGPVGTIAVMTEFIPQGFDTVMNLIILLSVNLGFLNLLPIPALDGGRLFFIGLDAVVYLFARKRIPQKFEGLIHAIGLLLLLGLIAFLVVNDIISITQGRLLP